MIDVANLRRLPVTYSGTKGDVDTQGTRLQDAHERCRGVPLALWQPSGQLVEQPGNHLDPDKRTMVKKKKGQSESDGFIYNYLSG